MLRVDAVADRRLYAILAQQYSGRRSGFSQERKRSKKKEPLGRGRPVETAQPWKSSKVAFGNFCLMISTAALKKACAKTAPAFFTVPHRPDCD